MRGEVGHAVPTTSGGQSPLIITSTGAWKRGSRRRRLNAVSYQHCVYFYLSWNSRNRFIVQSKKNFAIYSSAFLFIDCRPSCPVHVVQTISKLMACLTAEKSLDLLVVTNTWVHVDTSTCKPFLLHKTILPLL